MKKILSIIIILTVFLNCPVKSGAVENSVVDTKAGLAEFQATVNAKAYALMDVNTGTLLAAFCENEKLYPASVTKIMTLILVCEAIENGSLSIDEEIVCSASAASKGGSQIWLEAGERMTVHELMKAVVVYSANDACCLLGECIAGNEEAFCVLMNEKAEQLGMTNTFFDNCTGLDDNTTDHCSTAYDIALMSKELLSHELIRDYTCIWMDSLRNGATQIVNTNKLMRTYPGATGLKTGTTSKAGCCVSASARRDGLELIAVVMGAPDSKSRFDAASKLLDWGFASFEIFKPDPSGMYETEISVTHGVKQSVEIIHSDVKEIIIEKGSADSITSQVDLLSEISAPVEAGATAGSIIFYAGDKEICRSILSVKEKVEEMTMKNALFTLLFSLSKN